MSGPASFPLLALVVLASHLQHVDLREAVSQDKLLLSSSKTQWGKATFCTGGRVAQEGVCYQPFALGCFCFNSLCSSSSPYCSSYFREIGTPNTDEWNIWSYSVPLPAPGQETTTLLVVSDPQPFRYQATQSAGTPSGEEVDGTWKDSVRANYDVLKVVVAAHSLVWPDTKESLYASPSTPKYLQINGDLTEYWHYSQLSAYRQWYESDFDPGPMPLLSIENVSNIGPFVRTYPHLGNHDYVNNYQNCEGVDGDCSANALKWLRTLLSPYDTGNKLKRHERGNANFGWDQVYGFDADSLMYYYRISNYIIFNLGYVLNDNKIIKFNPEWLKQHVKEARDTGYNVLLFSHAGPGDDNIEWPEDELCNAIRDVQVAGIFIGHVHNLWGLAGSFDSLGCWFELCSSPDCRPVSGRIPVWRIGAPDYRHLLALRLDPSSYTLGWLSAPSGGWTDQYKNLAGDITAQLTGIDVSKGEKVTTLSTCQTGRPGDCSADTLPFSTPTLVIPPPSPLPQPPPAPRNALTDVNCTVGQCGSGNKTTHGSGTAQIAGQSPRLGIDVGVGDVMGRTDSEIGRVRSTQSGTSGTMQSGRSAVHSLLLVVVAVAALVLGSRL